MVGFVRDIGAPVDTTSTSLVQRRQQVHCDLWSTVRSKNCPKEASPYCRRAIIPTEITPNPVEYAMKANSRNQTATICYLERIESLKKRLVRVLYLR